MIEKIAFINVINKKNRVHNSISLGLYYLLSYLYKIKLRKNSAKIFDNLTIKNYEKVKDYKFLCFSINYKNEDLTYKFINKIKNKNNIIIVGGPQVSIKLKEILNNQNIDFAIYREGEVPLFLLLNNLSPQLFNNRYNKIKFENIPNLIYRNKNKIIINKYKIFNINNFLINYNLINYNYSGHGFFITKRKVFPIILSRGCNGLCNFCCSYNIFGTKIRYRNLKNIVNEIKLLINKYKVKEIQILDDNFTYDKYFVYTFIKLIKQNKINIKFSCPNGIRVDSIDYKLIKSLKNIGFYNITIGIESFNKKILKKMNKNIKISQIYNSIKIIKKNKLMLSGFLILGFPEATLFDNIKDIIKAYKSDLDFVTFTPFMDIKKQYKKTHNNIIINILTFIAYIIFYSKPKRIHLILKMLNKKNITLFLKRVIFIFNFYK